VIGSNQTPGDEVASPPAEAPPASPVGEVPAAAPAAPLLPAPAKKPGPFRRVFEWFWQGRTMAALRAEGRIGSPRALEFLRRAWRSVELAERALHPVPRLLHGSADSEARELVRQGVFWALAAEDLLRREASQKADGLEAVPAPDGRTLPALWARADRALLVTAAGGEGSAHALDVALRVADFADFADLSAEEQARQARDLLAFLRTLLGLLEAPRVSLDRVWTRRVVRTSAAFVLFVGLVVGVLALRSQRERERDWARDRPYKTSSVYPAVGCKSPEQDCAESPFYFFHTLEEEHAWVEIDLGAKRRFSAIRLINREDCCADRATPLAFEVSNDHKTWREVARRNEVFNSWYQEFSPVSARWVRVLQLRKSSLHLRKFSVLR
jgi:F5/8 type C domain-containing protein